MLFLPNKIKKASVYNGKGTFQETIRLFAKYSEQDWLSFSSRQSWEQHKQALFLYIEALLYTECVQDVETKYLDLFKKVHDEGAQRFEYERNWFILLNLIEGCLPLFQLHGDTKQVIEKLGPLLEREPLLTEQKFKIVYYMALANVQDGNDVDAKAKLADGLETKEPFWIAKIQELENRIHRNREPLFVELARGTTWIGAASLSPDATITAIMYWDGLLKLLNTDDGSEIAVFSDNLLLFQEEKATNMSLAFSPDGRYLAVGLGVGIVKIYDVQEQKLCAEHLHPGLDWEQLEQNAYYHEYTYVQFSASGKYMAIVPTADDYDPQGDDGYPIPLYFGTFYVIDFHTGAVVLEHSYKDRKIGAISFSPDERFIAVGMFGQEVTVWDIKCRQAITERNDFVWLGLPDRVGMTQTLAFTWRSDKLVYAARDAKITVVDLSGDRADYRIGIEPGYAACALCVDSKDYIIAAKYKHNQSLIISRWKIDDPNEQILYKSDRYVVTELFVNESHDELWVAKEPIIELRKYSTGELISKWDPYSWWYSYSVISNSVAINHVSGLAAFSYREGIRIGRSKRET